MDQLLPRGCYISGEKRIKKMIAEGSNWQIYSTNLDSYVLAVTPELYSRWISEYSLPDGVFLRDTFPSCRVFAGSGSYLVSSLEQGPYPENTSQIEAFSIAFRHAVNRYQGLDFHDAIYIEEYSLLLPVSFEKGPADNKLAYGQWLTGGIGVSIDSIERINEIMSWLPEGALIKFAEAAGFEVTLVEEQTEENSVEAKIVAAPNEQNERFVLIGRPELEQFFNDNIIDIVLHREQYERMGISFPGATILYGPPGCGKTYAVERLAEYLGWKRFDIDSSTVASPYIHDTSKKISEVFHAAIEAAPSILVIDEMEAFLSNRGLASSSGSHRIEEVAEFLRRIPDAVSKGVLVFGMTNMLDSIDPAILRRGRFDHIIEVKMASSEEIEALLKAKFSTLPVDSSVDVKALSEQLAGRPLSDIAFVLREAGRFAVKNNSEAMNKECFDNAVGLLPKQKDHKKIGF